jgi:23S rRNA pseudouridine2605 synthase
VDLKRDRIEVDSKPVGAADRVYLMLNKPRKLVVTASDERGRGTVFDCFKGKGLPFLGPVGRLDQASEGLLLFTNDTLWAASITNPANHIDKTYHVQIDAIIDDIQARRIQAGITDAGEFLCAKQVTILRQGTRNCWVEIVLDEGKNRHIRRLLAAFQINVLRLVRVAIGPLQLGGLAKGEFRYLTATEVQHFRGKNGLAK